MTPEPDFELHETSLDDGAERPHRTISWRVVALAAVVCALALAAIAARANLGNVGTAPQPAIHPAPTGVSVTQGVSIAPLPPGWQYVQPIGTQTLAQSQGILYACGSMDGLHVFVTTSLDKGAHWGALHTIGDGSHCTIALDQQNANQLAVAVYDVGFEQLDAQCLRSFDGGATFSAITLPDKEQCGGGLQWMGDDLFVSSYSGPGQIAATITPYTHVLAKSVAGGPFTWLNIADGASGIVANVYLTGVSGDALYLHVSAIDQPQINLIRSTDEGATWQPVIFTAENQTLTALEITSVDGYLIAEGSNRFYASADNGAHWSPSPTLPGPISNLAFVAPDGTIVTEFAPTPQNANDVRLYAAHPGAKTWQQLAPSASTLFLTGIDWNAAGHLTTLYSGYDANSTLVAYRVG